MTEQHILWLPFQKKICINQINQFWNTTLDYYLQFQIWAGNTIQVKFNSGLLIISKSHLEKTLLLVPWKQLFTQTKFNLEIPRNSCRLSARKELFELYFMLQCRAAESLTQLSTSIPPSNPPACLGYRGLSFAWDGWVTESSLAAFESRDLPATPISFMLFSTPPGAPS